MDERRVESTAKDAAEKVGEGATDLANQTQANLQGRIDQGKAMFENAKASAGDVAERATSIARDVSTAGAQAVGKASEVIQGVTREVGNQTSQTATALYRQGSAAGGSIVQFTSEQPVAALLLAAGLGYVLGYLIHHPR
jgi:hypothetical protein